MVQALPSANLSTYVNDALPNLVCSAESRDWFATGMVSREAEQA
jgi:hypothetical protein